MKKRKLKKGVIIISLIIILIVIIILGINKNNSTKNSNNGQTTIQEKTNEWAQEEYYIEDNLSRYQQYEKDNPNLDKKEIITRINANLDYEFYTDSKPADLDKDMFTLVNKYNYLDRNFTGTDIVNVEPAYTVYNAKLNKTAYENFKKMANAAKEENLTIKITTGYRSYDFQSTLYNNYVAKDGVIEADTYSARPGYSEHQLGFSADLTNMNNVSFDEFDQTEEYKWLQKNAYKYGFIQRYPEGKEYITGYMYESWHYRYVGIDVAKYIYEHNITYEEYYEYFIK